MIPYRTARTPSSRPSPLRGEGVRGPASLKAIVERSRDLSMPWVFREDDVGSFATPHLSGSANTQRAEPPSGVPISGVSVASAFIWLEPLPVVTATYCLPLTV